MLKKFIFGAALAIMSSSSMATVITGEFSLNDISGGTVSVDYGTNTVTFAPTTDNFVVENATGDFSASNGQLGTINSFTYSETPGAWSINPFFSFGGFTFAVTSIYSVTEDLSVIPSLDLKGWGTITNGTDSTVMAWHFNTSKMTWSATAVPAPAALAIFGAGLVGLAAAQRRRKLAA